MRKTPSPPDGDLFGGSAPEALDPPKLTGVLLKLAARAAARPEEWERTQLARGLQLGWKHVPGSLGRGQRRDEAGHHILALHRADGGPSDLEWRTVVRHLPDERLAPTELERRGDTWMTVLRPLRCPDCMSWLDVEAKLALRGACSSCQPPPAPVEADTFPCARCGRFRYTAPTTVCYWCLNGPKEEPSE